MTEAISSIIPTHVTSAASSQDSINSDTLTCTDKRQCEDGTANPAKKQKTEIDLPETASERVNRKKVAMLLVYCGKGYLGMQRNPGAKTIESDLMEAMLKAQLASKEHIDNPSKKMYFQRAARTDKGVSAAGQICSLMMDINVKNPVEKINEHLVEQIRVIAIQRVTKRFDSKNAASARTYQYLLPTYAFTPCEEFVLENYRITDETFQKVNDTLALFKGTKNFHNFTSGKKSNDPSARRYIMDFSMERPFVRKGVEFAVISVKGQSFMLHQIRKMIGLTVAIVRGLTGIEAVEKAYGNEKCDVPKAPGLGLMLDKVHYDYYNKRFGGDGVHEPILWEKYESEINSFKEGYIYPSIIDTEIEEKSMMKWLATLHLHHFDSCKSSDTLHMPLVEAYLQLKKLTKEQDLHSDSPTEADQSAVRSPTTETQKGHTNVHCTAPNETSKSSTSMTECQSVTSSDSNRPDQSVTPASPANGGVACDTTVDSERPETVVSTSTTETSDKTTDPLLDK